MILALSLPLLIAVVWSVCHWRNELRDIFLTGSESRYDRYICNAALRHNVEPELIKAVIHQETRFHPEMRGAAGEIGLMQVIPRQAVTDWAISHHIEVPCDGLLFNPELNIEIGTWYLGQALARWRGYRYYRELALCQYNAGGRWAKKWAPQDKQQPFMDKISISSTKRYVRQVMKKYRNYKAARQLLTRQRAK